MDDFGSRIPASVKIAESIIDCRLVGGSVRDLLLGKEPKDWDMATPFLPTEVVGAFEDNGYQVIKTGIKHGTVTVVIDGLAIEITTLRVDTDTDGRHATVEFTTDWAVDASRRDLTINAMHLKEGVVIDYFNGRNDLENRIIRFVGDSKQRIEEDYLRILRYFRFCGQIHEHDALEGDMFAPKIIADICQSKKGLRKISGERIWMEMKKILMFDNGQTIISMMKRCGLFRVISLPVFNDDKDWENTVSWAIGSNPITSLATLISTKTQVETVVDAWKLTKKETKLLSFLVDTRNEFGGRDINESECKNLVIDNGVDFVLELLKLIGSAPTKMYDLAAWDVPVFPLLGRDLIELGMVPGPTIGKMLNVAEQEWRNSEFTASKGTLLMKVAEKL